MSKRTLVVGQSGGPTAVINCSLVGIIREARARGFERVLGLRHGIEGLLSRDTVDLTELADSALDALWNTPSSALGACRHKTSDAELALAVDRLDALAAGAFIYIGGNDSADTAERIHRAVGGRIACVGVPKTVDNDLPEMDHTPGFGSAARFLATMLMEVSRDTEAMRRTDPIKIVEVAGRHAGWLPLAASLGRRAEAEGPHLVYLPERPFDADEMLDQVESAFRAHAHAVIVMSENQPSTDGRVLGADAEPEHIDDFGHPYFPSPAAYLARQIRDRLGLRARWERPGTAQRMSVAHRSTVDAVEAGAVGCEAVRLASGGASGTMVTLLRQSDKPYRWTLGSAPMHAIANAERRLPPEMVSEPWEQPTADFRRYAEPLIGEPLPTHAHLT
jgi:6-phosphofructokinase 1